MAGFAGQIGEVGMLYLKGCARCKGDMHINRDMYGSYRECLQCGYMVDIEEPNKLLESLNLAAETAEKKKVA
jgi:hypothetical protein|tara:strand:+ start:2382 stop:2597 length:216 start_codon:yes stop_codon:yes gene_type:complete